MLVVTTPAALMVTTPAALMVTFALVVATLLAMAPNDAIQVRIAKFNVIPLEHVPPPVPTSGLVLLLGSEPANDAKGDKGRV